MHERLICRFYKLCRGSDFFSVTIWTLYDEDVVCEHLREDKLWSEVSRGYARRLGRHGRRGTNKNMQVIFPCFLSKHIGIHIILKFSYLVYVNTNQEFNECQERMFLGNRSLLPQKTAPVHPC